MMQKGIGHNSQFSNVGFNERVTAFLFIMFGIQRKHSMIPEDNYDLKKIVSVSVCV